MPGAAGRSPLRLPRVPERRQRNHLRAWGWPAAGSGRDFEFGFVVVSDVSASRATQRMSHSACEKGGLSVPVPPRSSGGRRTQCRTQCRRDCSRDCCVFQPLFLVTEGNTGCVAAAREGLEHTLAPPPVTLPDPPPREAGEPGALPHAWPAGHQRLPAPPGRQHTAPGLWASGVRDLRVLGCDTEVRSELGRPLLWSPPTRCQVGTAAQSTCRPLQVASRRMFTGTFARSPQRQETEVRHVIASSGSCQSFYSGPPLGWGSCFPPSAPSPRPWSRLGLCLRGT